MLYNRSQQDRPAYGLDSKGRVPLWRHCREIGLVRFCGLDSEGRWWKGARELASVRSENGEELLTGQHELPNGRAKARQEGIEGLSSMSVFERRRLPPVFPDSHSCPQERSRGIEVRRPRQGRP